MVRKSACFYCSLDPQSVISAALVKTKYPTTEFYDIKGLTAVQIDTLVGGLTAVSYHDIWVVCDKISSQFTVGPAVAFVSAANLVTLDAKLIVIAPPQDPIPDSAPQDFSAQDNGQVAPDLKLRPRMVFEALWPNNPVSLVAHLLGGFNLTVQQALDSVNLYYGLRAKTVNLSDSGFLLILKNIIDKDGKLNEAATTINAGVPQDTVALGVLISEGTIVADLLTITALTLPEDPIVVPG